MTIKFECNFCRKKYRLKDEHAGKKFRCKECEEPIRVPKLVPEKKEDEWDFFNGDEYESQDEDSYSEAPPKKRVKSPGNKKTKRSKKQKTQDSSTSKLWKNAFLTFACSYLLVLLVGFAFAPQIGSSIFLFACAASIFSMVAGLFWLLFNCFRVSPFWTMLMIFLPFVGWIGFSSSLDLLGPQNKTPWKLFFSGFFFFFASFLGASILNSVA